MNKETKIAGFSAENEVIFLRRLPGHLRLNNLEQELKTQLAEDFGLLEFTLKYKMDGEGRIVDELSGEMAVELTRRGGVEAETESLTKIEEGLKRDPKKTWIHFSPQNEELGYPSDCIDFWRKGENEEVIWNRMVVRNDIYQMNRVRNFLSGEEDFMSEMEILASPVCVNLKLAEIFPLFELSEKKYDYDLDYIDRVVAKHLKEFEGVFGDEIVEDDELIFRLYSACFKALEEKRDYKKIIGRIELQNFMFGVMNQVRVEASHGCAATTRVGSFGEKIGYYILGNGQVVRGIIPEGEGYKECKHCGCWYKGEKCPFC